MSATGTTAEWSTTGINRRRFLTLWSVFALVTLLILVYEIMTLVREGGARKPIGWSFNRPGGVWTIAAVDPTGPAASLLRAGDRIVAIDGDRGAQRIGPRWYLRDRPDQASYTITVLRDGTERTVTVPWPVIYDRGERTWQWIHLGTAIVFFAFGLLIAFAKPDSQAAQRAVSADMLTLAFFLTLVLETDSGIVSHVPILFGLGYYFVRPFHLAAGYRFIAGFPLGDRSTPAWRRFERIFYGAAALIWVPSVYGGIIRALGPERATAIALAQYPFSIVHDTLVGSLALLFAAIAGVANAVVCWRNYHHVPPGDLRRRLKWVSISIPIGLLPIVVVGPLLFVRGLSSGSERFNLIVHLVNSAVIIIPVSMGYAVLKHRVMGFQVVIRAGVRYLLARNVLRLALALPLVLIGLELARHPERSVGQLLGLGSGPANVGLIVLAALALRFRAPLMTRIDRRFFREAYQRDQIFVSLAEAVGRADDIPALARLLSSQLDLALHPTRVLALTRRTTGTSTSGELEIAFTSDGGMSLLPLQGLGHAVLELPDLAGVTEVRALGALSSSTRALFDALGIVLVVPVRGPNEGLVGLLLLGEKRSEEPYTRDDRTLLDTTAAQTGVVWENLVLRHALAREQSVRRQLATRVEGSEHGVVMECPACGRCYDGGVERCEADDRTLAPSLPGSRMLDGKYRLERVVGRGGMGAVYQATDVRLERTVAVKVLLGTMFDDAVARQRFAREARASARIVHPNVVGVFDFGELDGGAYLVLEYLSGETLRQRLERGGPLDAATLERVLSGLFDGVAAAHAQGVVHRDLKPENVLIDRYRRWRLADFGIANATGEEIAGASGTPAFAPPEQLLGETQDAAADCFSLAAIVAFALTGNAPFGERDSASILARELRGDVDLTAYQPEIADWLRRGLSAKPDDRFTDAAAMQAAWREAVQSVLERERQLPWWRRWFGTDGPDGAGVSWTADSLFTS